MTINTALIGVGEQGTKNLLPCILQVDKIKLSAVVDVDIEKANKIAKRYSINNAYSRFEDLIRNEKIDVVFVACPPQIHVEVAKLAISKGISVFVEKPPSVSLEEITALHKLAKKNNVVTGVGMNFRFSSPYKKLCNIVKNIDFGTPCLINIKHYANKPNKSMWNLKSKIRSFLLAQAIHPIDLLLTYGDRIKKKNIDIFKSDEGLIIKLNVVFTNNLMGSVITGSLFPHFESNVEIVSDNGNKIILDSLWNLNLSSLKNMKNMINESKRWALDWNPSPLDSGYERSGYLGEIEEFIDAVGSKKQFTTDFKSQIPVYKILDEIEDLYLKKYGNN